MASIWDMLFPGGGQAPQFADPNGNPNAQLPVPFPGPQQAPYFGPPSSNIEDRRGESIPMVDQFLNATTGLNRDQWGDVLRHPMTPLIPADYPPGEQSDTPLAREAGIGNIGGPIGGMINRPASGMPQQFMSGADDRTPALPIPPQQAPWLPQTTPWPQDAAPLTAQQRYRASQAGDESRMPTFQRTGPTLPGMIAQSMEDTGRMMTTAPPPMPRGAYMDAGGPAQGTADPQEFANWLGEMRQRGELAPSMALEMIGGGTAFAPRSALGMAGSKLVQPAAEATEAAQTAQPGIRAYHGSPHDFTQFDLSKIGTGEGAQAYGHGLYMAENEGVARSYKAAGQPSYLGADRIDAAKKLLEEAGGDRNTAIKLADERMRGTTKYGEGKLWQDVANNFDELTGRGPGHMYEVNIGAHPEQFLDWDKPLSEQHPQVQSALEKIAAAKARPRTERSAISDALSQPKKSGNPTGASIYEDLARGQPNPTFDPIRDPLGPTTTISHSAAAQQLREAGIPGIRYLDQGSRTAGEGSRNYVVFDPSKIRIDRKYGIAALLGGGAAASQLPIPPQKAPVF